MFVRVTVFLHIICTIVLFELLQTRAEGPENFPSHIPLTQGDYENWSNELSVPNLWIATPKNPADVVTLANWAHKAKYTLRASGYMHNWSPLTVTIASKINKKVILVDTTKNLVNMKMIQTSYHPTTVQVETGTTLFNLLTYLEENGFGLYTSPAPGEITLGGLLAIGGHGTGIPAVNEKIPPGFTYGTLSNLIMSLTAVVWDQTSNAYVLKQFLRSDADCKAFLVHLGRAFITEVTLLVGPNYNLQCVSRTDIKSDELFADPLHATSNTRTFSSFLDQTGRVETITIMFTNNPWIKIWKIVPNKPSTSRRVTKPYNYPFADSFPEKVSLLLGNITNSASVLTPVLLGIERATLTLPSSFSSDIWGQSKNLLLYVKPTTLRVTVNGYAILTNRRNVQNIISTVTGYIKKLISDYARHLKYPLNGQMEIRASSLDQPGIFTNAEPPTLSPVRPVENHPEFDVAIWFNVLSFPGALHLFEAMSKIESFLYSRYNGTDAYVRPEWSKGWSYTNTAAWRNEHLLKKIIPSLFAYTKNDGFNWAVATFDKYDPHRIFTNDFLDKFLVKS